MPFGAAKTPAKKTPAPPPAADSSDVELSADDLDHWPKGYEQFWVRAVTRMRNRTMNDLAPRRGGSVPTRTRGRPPSPAARCALTCGDRILRCSQKDIGPFTGLRFEEVLDLHVLTVSTAPDSNPNNNLPVRLALCTLVHHTCGRPGQLCEPAGLPMGTPDPALRVAPLGAQESLQAAQREFFKLTASIEWRMAADRGPRLFWTRPAATPEAGAQLPPDSGAGDVVHALEVAPEVMDHAGEWDRCVREMCPAAHSRAWGGLPGCDSAKPSGKPPQYYYLLHSVDGKCG